MRVLLRGGGFVNKGAEAMLLTVKAELTRRIPQARWSSTPGVTGACLGRC